MKKFLFIVIGDKPQAGKTTLANYIAELTGGVRISTSDAILPRVAEKVGLTVDEIKSRRKDNPHRFRSELIVEGDKMAVENYPPGVACLDMVNGHNFIVLDGIRRVTELNATIQKAELLSYKVLVIGTYRPSNKAGADNTEPDILGLANYTIFNNGSLRTLKKKAFDILEDWRIRRRIGCRKSELNTLV